MTAQGWELLGLLVGLLVFALRSEVNIRKERAKTEAANKKIEQQVIADKSELEKKSENLNLEARGFFQTQYSKLADENKIQANDIAGLKSEVTGLKYELAEKKGQLKALQDSLANLKSEHDAIRAELKQYQTENGQLISENSRLNKDNQTIKQQKERAEKLNREYLQQISQQSAKIEQLETQVKELDMRLRHYEGTVAKQAEIIKQLQSDAMTDTQKIPLLPKPDTELNIGDVEDTEKLSAINTEQPPVPDEDKKNIA